MAIAIVSTVTKVSGNFTGTTVSITRTGATANNALVLLGSVWNTSNTWAAPTCADGGDSFTVRSATATSSGGGTRARAIIAFANVGSSGDKTVTLTFANSTYYYEIGLLEISGLATSSMEDAGSPTTVNDVDTSGSTDVTATGLTTTNASSIVLAVLSLNSGNANLAISTPTGYTQSYINNDAATTIGMWGGYKILSSTGTETPAWSHGNNPSDAGGAVLVALKAASGGSSVALSGLSGTSARGTEIPNLAVSL